MQMFDFTTKQCFCLVFRILQTKESGAFSCSYQTMSVNESAGCEYGDRATWCESYADLDCSVDDQRLQCCSTCAQRTQQPPGSTGTNHGSCPLGDGAHFCSTMPAMDCYHYSDLCCETCPTHYTGIEGSTSVSNYCLFA